MPGQTHIQIVEQTLPRHINFAANRFFGRCAVKTNRAPQLACSDQFFKSHRRPEACRAEQIVPAPVTRRAGFQRLFHRLRFLRDARQRVKLAEHPNDRPALSEARHKSRRHTGDATLHFKPLPLGIIGQQLRGTRLANPRRRLSPDADWTVNGRYANAL